MQKLVHPEITSPPPTLMSITLKLMSSRIQTHIPPPFLFRSFLIILYLLTLISSSVIDESNQVSVRQSIPNLQFSSIHLTSSTFSIKLCIFNLTKCKHFTLKQSSNKSSKSIEVWKYFSKFTSPLLHTCSLMISPFRSSEILLLLSPLLISVLTAS